MSVYRSDYIIYGWKLPYKVLDADGKEINFWDDKFLPYIEGHPGIEYTLIQDGMGGEYTVFGKNIRSDGDNGWNFIYLDISFDHVKVMQEYIKVFGKEPDSMPHLFIFSHYS